MSYTSLTGWTLRGAIQPSIPIYLTQETFTEVSKAFPYLTNAGKAVRFLSSARRREHTLTL